MRMLLLIIGTGGFIGSILRYLLSYFIQSRLLTSFPLGTLFVNLTGCLLIGMIYSWSEENDITAGWRLFLATGICGGFTTFSAFTHETFAMLRDGQSVYALVYILGSIILGCAATIVGYQIVKLI